MPLYEVVREIENSCANNQMRDVFFEEIETDDPVRTVRDLLKADSDVELTLEAHDADALTVYAQVKGITQRFLFTRI